MKQIAEDNRVNIIFMTYHNRGWGQPEKAIHSTYEKLVVPVVDNYSIFKKAKEIGLNIRGKDGWHPNDTGYLLIAHNIFNKMVSLKMIDSEPVNIFDEEYIFRNHSTDKKKTETRMKQLKFPNFDCILDLHQIPHPFAVESFMFCQS
jgi:hypothetical protein